jgi:4-amino-4-deoxy-L-arabinose transferase-like glycosyltransferase
MPFAAKLPSKWVAVGVVVLIVIFWIELLVPARRQSQAIDEACHIYSGYSYWTRADFGMNPEHPPLVKLLAALPLLHMPLNATAPPPIFFKFSEFLAGKQFLYSNDADAILFRTRVMVSLLAVALALLIFAATYEMFGVVAAFVAMALCCFEPNLIAHGSLVTTDVAMAMFLFATVYAFYRYVKKPTAARLCVAAVVTGLALSAKHSAVLLAPILILLALAEAVRRPGDGEQDRAGRSLRMAGALAVIAVVALTILWAAYGFRFQARPTGEAMNPSLQEYAGRMESHAATEIVLTAAHYHLLPEAYLYGLTDVSITPRYLSSYLFGKVYPHGRWFYFPAAFIIKSTLGFLGLLLLLPAAILLYGRGRGREFVFLGAPPAVYFLVAMASGFNIGIRHILPVYPFLIVLAGFSAAAWTRKSRIWMGVVCALLLFHIVSSVLVFPHYLTYTNELWGGSAQTYKVLANSNVDWGQQLKETKQYLDQRHINDCWIDYFSWALADPSYYGIPCKPLPGFLSQAFSVYPPAAPAHINGTVLISVDELSGEGWGPGVLNPYRQFKDLHLNGEIANSILVFNGSFDISEAAAKSHVFAAEDLLQEGHADEALTEAQTAVSLAPNDVASETLLCQSLMRVGRKEEAREVYARAMKLAQTEHPEFQGYWIWQLESSGAK